MYRNLKAHLCMNFHTLDYEINYNNFIAVFRNYLTFKNNENPESKHPERLFFLVFSNVVLKFKCY